MREKRNVCDNSALQSFFYRYIVFNNNDFREHFQFKNRNRHEYKKMKFARGLVNSLSPNPYSLTICNSNIYIITNQNFSL